MRGAIKIGIVLAVVVGVLPLLAIIGLFVGMWQFTPPKISRLEIQLPNQASLIIDGKRTSRSEHGFSQHAGYRPPGSNLIEWFGDVSDGMEPQFYQTGPLVVVVDFPAAQLYVRTHRVDADAGEERDHDAIRVKLDPTVRPAVETNWKSFALIFPNDLGPFPISYYAEKNGLTTEEVSRINELGGKRERKYPTTYIQSFDPATRDLKCSYHVDDTNSWPLHLQLSKDGTRLSLIAIGETSR